MSFENIDSREAFTEIEEASYENMVEMFAESLEEESEHDNSGMWDDCDPEEDGEDMEFEDYEDDGQPSEYDEWQDFMGGDDSYDSYDEY